jgi:hypothetical protein
VKSLAGQFDEVGADGPGIRVRECGELDIALLLEKSGQGRLFLVSVTHLTPSGRTGRLRRVARQRINPA